MYNNPQHVSFNGKQIALFHLSVTEALFSNIARLVTNWIDAGIVSWRCIFLIVEGNMKVIFLSARYNRVLYIRGFSNEPWNPETWLVHQPRLVRIGKNYALCLEYSFSRYRPPGLWIKYVCCRHYFCTCGHSSPFYRIFSFCLCTRTKLSAEIKADSKMSRAVGTPARLLQLFSSV